MNKPLEDYDPFSPQLVESPWEFFSILRKQAPLYQLPNKAYYLISRYNDVMAATLDIETYSSNLVAVLLSNSTEAAPQILNLSGLNTDEADNKVQAVDVLAIADPPSHTRQRRVSNRAFTMRRVAAMEPRIRALTESLVNGFIREGVCNWVQQLAVPLPMTLIIEMLGFPREDMPQLKRWSDASVALLSGINTETELMEHGLKVNDMIQYLAAQYERVQNNINENKPEDNVLGDLIRESEIDSESLSRNEIISILIQLLTAGNETTTSLIGSAMMLLVQDQKLQQRLRDHPEKIEPFIEEALRVESPFHGHFRVTTKDTVVAGTPLPKGSRVMLLWSSANRDEQQFSCPHQANTEREKPRRHFAFGYGIHQCIGAALARMEANIAIETILQKTKNIQAAPDNDFKHIPSLFVRSLQKLNIQWTQ